MQRTIKTPGMGKVRFTTHARTYMGNAAGFNVAASGTWNGKTVKGRWFFLVLSAEEALDRAQERWERSL